MSVWKPHSPRLWQDVGAEFRRTGASSGDWHFFHHQIDDPLIATVGDLKFKVKFTPFGHLGIFPEQQQNWQLLAKITSPGLKVLNLFGYTGGASFSCARSGAQVVHVDASRTTVSWAGENAQLNSCPDTICWITDDARKFVQREIRRENFYDAVILDPPSFGRGKRGEVWKFTQHMPELIAALKKLTRGEPAFILLTTHTPGITALSLHNLLQDEFGSAKFHFSCTELTVREYRNNRFLPAGMGCLMRSV